MGFVFDIIDFLLRGNWKASLIFFAVVAAFFGLVFLMAPRGPGPTPPPAAVSGHG